MASNNNLTHRLQSPKRISTSKSNSNISRSEVIQSPLHLNKIMNIVNNSNNNNVTSPSTKLTKLLLGSIGIYISFVYYGILLEKLFSNTIKNKTNFQSVWFLQTFESLFNVMVGYIGTVLFPPTNTSRKPPQHQFLFMGIFQVTSKATSILSLSHGVSFPIVTLAKSAKMAPVMMGQYMFSGTIYQYHDYIHVCCILGGTLLIILSSSNSYYDILSFSTPLGLVLLLSSLIVDGLTAGIQQNIKNTYKYNSSSPFQFLLYTHSYMSCTAFLLSILTQDWNRAMVTIHHYPHILYIILQACLCSSLGQLFIFWIIVHFDPLICTTITTTRKIVSVLISLYQNESYLNQIGWSGVLLACVGVLSEVGKKVGLWNEFDDGGEKNRGCGRMIR